MHNHFWMVSMASHCGPPHLWRPLLNIQCWCWPFLLPSGASLSDEYHDFFAYWEKSSYISWDKWCTVITVLWPSWQRSQWTRLSLRRGSDCQKVSADTWDKGVISFGVAAKSTMQSLWCSPRLAWKIHCPQKGPGPNEPPPETHLLGESPSASTELAKRWVSGVPLMPVDHVLHVETLSWSSKHLNTLLKSSSLICWVTN